MKIAVCVKQVPDTDQVKFDRKTGTLMRSGAPGVLNPADFYAVRTAVGLAGNLKKQGEEASVVALTMGPKAAEAVLRESIAIGADEVVLLCDRAFAGADTWATSLVLSKAIEKIGEVSLIITGKQSTDGETGHIGPQIAEHLKLPQITSAKTIRKSQDKLEVERTFEGYTEVLETSIPAVIAVGMEMEIDKDLPIGSICEAYEKEITTWNKEDLGLGADEIGLKGSMTEVKRTYFPETSKKGRMISGSVSEMAEELFTKLCEGHVLDNSGANAALQGGTEPYGGKAQAESGGNDEQGNEVWIFAQRRGAGLHPISYELLGEGRRLADQMGKRLGAVLFGNKIREMAEELVSYGADIVYTAEEEFLELYSTDAYAALFSDLIKEKKPSIVLIGGTDLGRDLAPRAAARIKTGLTVDCTDFKIEEATNRLLQIRPAFGSSLMAEIVTKEGYTPMCTVRQGMFKAAPQNRGRVGTICGIREILPVSAIEAASGIKVRILSSVQEEKGQCALLNAKIVVAGGMGIGSGENFELLNGLAEKLHGALGGTRAALNEGWITHEQMIGQTGTVIAPKLYIACGISGAVQHMLGASGAGCIVAVNNQPDAPIFEYADYGIVADYKEFIPKLLELLK